MNKESKIMLVSGLTITFREEDKICLVKEIEENQFEVIEVSDIKDIVREVMECKKSIVINHQISSGEYMEYYLTREKITWGYYSEIPVKDEEE